MTHLHSRAAILTAVLGMCLAAFCGCEKKTPKPRPAPRNTSKDFAIDLGTSVTLEMVWIPGGEFLMGSPASEEKRINNEGPQTKVQLEGFWMGKYEVTQEQYQAIMGKNPSQFKGVNNPVEKVSWNDAMDFCKKLSQKSGKQFTLPTEAQWEYACRARTTTPFHFGDSMSSDEADFDDTWRFLFWRVGTNRRKTVPVGSFPANAFGLHDMHGNVWEWCLSLYKPYPYSDLDGRNDESVSGARSLRGGSRGVNPWLCRSAYRGGIDPSNTLNYLGLRVVCNPH